MGSTGLQGVVGIAVVLCSALAGASDLTLHLKGTDPVKRNTVQFQCDAQGATMGLPAGTFAVEYLNGAGNHLAVVPVKGNSMIFVTVPSGSGAKYAAEEFTWWDAGGRGTTFASDFPGPKASSACHVVK
ncbi:MliC family protein [Edaphobacter modestus]|uniref:Membrane-bound inhibitor of C-type lysozyme n=1 Tax=Edaphobacter modestus TaxID=388466 RepID=A0A4V2G4S6_9BACT|nr:MliC family protein [Edaphobacter modestus]RZU42126.1 membrane-bound inhibitor of C-type lysozyme [Edaphobacter modestus]